MIYIYPRGFAPCRRPLISGSWLAVLLAVFIGLVFDFDALDLHCDCLGALVVVLGLHFGDLGHFLVVFCTIGAGHGTPEGAKWYSH